MKKWATVFTWRDGEENNAEAFHFLILLQRVEHA